MPNLTPTLWLLLLFVLIPGFVANRVYALWCPGQKQDWEKALLEPLTWSAVNLMFWFWWVLPILKTEFNELNRFELSAAVFFVCVFSPTILSTVWYKLRAWSYIHQSLGVDYPIAKSFDYFVKQNNEHYYILFHLKNKSKVGGLFGPKSYVTCYPQEPEFYVEELVRVDQTTGKFLERIEATYGSVIRQSEWDFIEFLKMPEGNSDVGSTDKDTDRGDNRTGATGDGTTAATEAESSTGGIGNSATEANSTASN